MGTPKLGGAELGPGARRWYFATSRDKALRVTTNETNVARELGPVPTAEQEAELYDASRRLAAHLARRSGVDPHELLSDAFVRFRAGIGKIRLGGGRGADERWQHWYLRCFQSALCNAVRTHGQTVSREGARTSSRVRAAAAGDLPTTTAPSATTLLGAQHRCVRAVLTEPDGEAWVRHHLHGVHWKEGCAALGVGRDAFFTRLRRVTERLLSCMAARPGSEE